MKSKRTISKAMVCAVGLILSAPGSALAQPDVKAPPPKAAPAPNVARTPVAVHRDWPLRRAARAVVVRPPRVAVRVEPQRFVPTVIFKTVIVRPQRGADREPPVWEGSDTVANSEGWVEFTLDCNARGRKLWLDVRDGRAVIDWVEVVFASGDTQVVDFGERTIPPGLFALLDFSDGRQVDHVRVVAKAKSTRATLVFRLDK